MAHGLQIGLRNGGLRRGGLHAGLEGGSIFNIASLDLNFARYKNIGSLVTFTRASSATYVGSDGVLRSAVTNLLLRSEEFGTTWVPTNASIAANTTTAPNGTVTANTLIEDISTGGHVLVQSISGAPDNTSFTSSCYCKALTRSWVAVTVVGKDGSINRVWFNLASGSQGTTNGTVTSFSAVNAGDGWYRIAVTAPSATGGGNLQIRISLGSADNTASYTGDGTSGLFLWGTQLEQSASVGEYIPTTSVINSAPRFNHNPTTGESLGLLVEEARTNLLLRSEEFGTTWTATRASVSTDATLAPSGATTADKLVEDTTATNTHQIQQTVTLVANTTYATSFYIKSSERTELRLLFSAGTDGINAAFNLSTGVATAQANTGLGVIASATLTPVGNGWFRATATGIISPLSTSATLTLRLLSSGSNSYTGDGTSGLFLWGAQVEAGAFPTSYIPTTTAAATRSADVASITGTNFSSWYNQTEGTVFADTALIYNGGRYFMFDNGPTITERWDTRYSSFGSTGNSWSNNVQDVALNTNTVPTSPASNIRLAFANASNNAAIASNGAGAVLGIDTSSTMPTGQTRLFIGSFQGTGTYLNGTIRRLVYWGQRLPNNTLQSITL